MTFSYMPEPIARHMQAWTDAAIAHSMADPETARLGICPVCEGNLPYCTCARHAAYDRWRGERAAQREERLTPAALRAKLRLLCWYLRSRHCERWRGAFCPHRLTWCNAYWPSLGEWLFMPRHVAEFFAGKRPSWYRADESWCDEFDAWWESLRAAAIRDTAEGN